MDPQTSLTDDDAGRALAPRRRHTKPIPAATLTKLLDVCRLAKQANASADRADRQACQAALEALLQELPDWPVGLREVPTIRISDDGRVYVCLILDNPRQGGPTERLLDFEAILVLLAHCVAGGLIALEPHGPGRGGYFYFRLTLPRADRPAKFRAYVLRLVVGTPIGRLTKEHHDYHDLRRGSLGRLRDSTGQQRVWLGVEQAKNATLDRVSDRLATRSSSLPPGLDIETARKLLDDAYALLGAVPLGQGEAA